MARRTADEIDRQAISRSRENPDNPETRASARELGLEAQEEIVSYYDWEWRYRAEDFTSDADGVVVLNTGESGVRVAQVMLARDVAADARLVFSSWDDRLLAFPSNDATGEPSIYSPGQHSHDTDLESISIYPVPDAGRVLDVRWRWEPDSGTITIANKKYYLVPQAAERVLIAGIRAKMLEDRNDSRADKMGARYRTALDLLVQRQSDPYEEDEDVTRPTDYEDY